MASANRVTDDVQAIVAGVRGGRGTIGQLVNDDALYQRAKAIGAEAEQAMANVRAATAEVKSVLAEFRSGDSPVTGLAGSLQQTLAEARDVMAGLAESTEALKRNFFLRGFFNRRGYFDLDDVSVDDYRQGVLVGQDRKALRIWVKADLLFDRDSKGTLTLTSQGRARLDSAMSQFVQYPKTSPFVVEGYAQAPTADERYLVSRARAQLVSDYVVGKYGLDSNSTTTMAMGAEAQDSPTGDSWDGIALAMFVRK